VNSVAIVMSTAGGSALFLYSLRVLSSALKRAIGEKMRALLERLTGKAYRAFIVGAFLFRHSSVQQHDDGTSDRPHQRRCA